MNPPVVVPLRNDASARKIASRLGAEIGVPVVRQFPDGETYVSLAALCEDRDVVLVVTLDRPDGKFLQLCFLADLARDLGARRVVLLAPYLGYMRQDARFKPGEAVTSRSFARLLSRAVDALITVDPHLHRYASLADLYTIPTRVIHAAPLLADWIKTEIEHPILIGPDSESEQWVAVVARRAEAPYIVLEKRRGGDRDVDVSVPDVERWSGHQPVLVDDIISTARTMIETVHHLKRAGLGAPICIGVHAVFAGDAYAALQAAGAGRIVTTDTVVHESNSIAISEVLAGALQEVLAISPGSTRIP